MRDDEPPDDNRRNTEICLRKMDANLADHARSIRGGEAEPVHGCHGCDGHNTACSGYAGILYAPKEPPSARDYSYI